ncbi:MAG: hypothetical protein M1370_10815 [Bacteroidetes bacterium]|nr:hypothetical protein [Bacteroidota bacterium]
MADREAKLRASDYFAAAVGGLCVAFGAMILFHAFTDYPSPSMFLVGAAILGFGVVRLRSVWQSLVRR